MEARIFSRTIRIVQLDSNESIRSVATIIATELCNSAAGCSAQLILTVSYNVCGGLAADSECQKFAGANVGSSFAACESVVRSAPHFRIIPSDQYS